MVSRKLKLRSSKKKHLDRVKRQTKWATFWVVLKKYGKGVRMHPSNITHVKRSWNRNKLKIKPRILKKKHLG